MSKSLIQSELDMAEEYILTCIFGNVQNPQINSTIKSFLALKGKDPIELINEYIDKFEAIVKPLLKSNGYVDGEKLSKLLEIKLNQSISLTGDCRLIEVARVFEPQLKSIGSLLR